MHWLLSRQSYSECSGGILVCVCSHIFAVVSYFVWLTEGSKEHIKYHFINFSVSKRSVLRGSGSELVQTRSTQKQTYVRDTRTSRRYVFTPTGMRPLHLSVSWNNIFAIRQVRRANNWRRKTVNAESLICKFVYEEKPCEKFVNSIHM